MNFDLSDEQQVVKDLATRIFDDLATPERVRDVCADGGHDADLWQALADAGLLGLCLPETVGGVDLGSGMGMVELCLITEQQGRRVAPVPLACAVVAARCIANFLPAEAELLARFVAGESIITAALAEPGRNDPFTPGITATTVDGGLRLVGDKPAVAALSQATHVLVPARHEDANVVALVETSAEGVHIEALVTTNHESQGHLTIDTVIPAARIITDAAALDQLVWHTLVAHCAIQLGVAEGAVALAAEHVSTREQFNRPLSAFQAVSQRAADGYIMTEALRTTVLNASWQCDHGEDPRADTLAAAYWASEGTQQVVLGAQHLHGGLGADTDHPVHRQFLWGMQYASTLGNASTHLERLGRLIAHG